MSEIIRWREHTIAGRWLSMGGISGIRVHGEHNMTTYPENMPVRARAAGRCEYCLLAEANAFLAIFTQPPPV
jgi:hypothetical protein